MTRGHHSCYKFHFQIRKWKNRLRRLRLRQPLWLLFAVALLLSMRIVSIKLTDRVRDRIADSACSVSMDAGDHVILEEQIEKLPDECKERMHIGLDGDGNLALFDGSPKEGKVTRTFFQLDVESMESSLPSEVLQQLVQGIRITDMEAYDSVLSTFGDFAIEVMKKE